MDHECMTQGLIKSWINNWDLFLQYVLKKLNKRQRNLHKLRRIIL